MQRLSIRKQSRNILVLFFALYASTFLPNLGILNSLVWIGPFPLPLFWVLFINIINTILLFVIYKKFFKPFALRVEKEFPSDEVVE